MDNPAELIACHDCDVLYRKRPLQEGEKARCARCGALLYQHRWNSVERALMLTLAALIMFMLANSFPLLSFKIGGQVEIDRIVSGVLGLYRQGFWQLAVLVFGVSILIPLLKMLNLLYVLVPLYLNRRPWKLATACRLIKILHPWAMTEVYLLGIFVAIVKLLSYATIAPGIAFYSFGALIILMAAADSTLDMEELWERVEITPWKQGR